MQPPVLRTTAGESLAEVPVIPKRYVEELAARGLSFDPIRGSDDIGQSLALPRQGTGRLVVPDDYPAWSCQAETEWLAALAIPLGIVIGLAGLAVLCTMLASEFAR